MIELYAVEDGFGFRVQGIVQDYDPDCEGFVVMSEERAMEAAQAVLARISTIDS